MPSQPLTRTEIALHWIVGLGMIALLIMGTVISQAELRPLIGPHKSWGMVLFVFVLARVILRLVKGWPEPVSGGAAWEHGLAKLIHWVLILGTLAMPLSGMMGSVMAGRGLQLFGLDLVAMNLGPDGAREAINMGLARAAGAAHGIIGKLLIAVVLLHIAGAVKHHVLDRDATLRRMLGRA